MHKLFYANLSPLAVLCTQRGSSGSDRAYDYVHEDGSSSSKMWPDQGFFSFFFSILYYWKFGKNFPRKGKISQIYTIKFLEKRKIAQISCQERDKNLSEKNHSA
jgi:hypothetical protein